MKLKLPPNSPIHAPDFVFGAATSAFQIEGAAERRLASIWDMLLLAHGLALRALRANSPDTLNGIVLNFTPFYGASDADSDRLAARLADDTDNHWYLGPLLEGAYPQLIDSLPKEHLPDIVEGDLDLMQQPLDFLGVNYYTRGVVRADGTSPNLVTGFARLDPHDHPLSDMGWEIYPQGLCDILVSLDQRYSLPPVYVTENGIALKDALLEGSVHDEQRTEYIQQHLLAVEQAVHRGVEVAGYFYWSLLDNFEWAEGYAKRFGLVYVDYATQERTIKASGNAFRDFLHARPFRRAKNHLQGCSIS